MILNRGQIEAAQIVEDAVETSRRPTTYDATIGDIVVQGEVWEKDRFKLEKRGVVWVVSKEEFAFPNHLTGLATLKTTWTHKGLLALNVGVVDPGWKGPLATALVNFSGGKITICKGDPFLRVLVFDHEPTGCDAVIKPRSKYLDEVLERSKHFATTFLDMRSLTGEVATEVFKLPKLAVLIGWVGLVITVGAIFGTMAVNVWSDYRGMRIDQKVLESRLHALEQAPKTNGTVRLDPAKPPST